MLVIAGPSAVGKTTVSDEILRQNPEFTLIRSATTRAPRGDGHDSEYLYLSEAEFRREIDLGGMVEYTEYSGSLYGTPKSELIRAEREGKIPLLILELSGVGAVRESEYSDRALLVYLYDSLDILEKRLYARYMTPPTKDGAAKFEKRRMQNIADYRTLCEKADMFDLVISNATSPADTASAIIKAMSEPLITDKKGILASLYEMANTKNNNS